jgi:hypothetical protein
MLTSKGIAYIVACKTSFTLAYFYRVFDSINTAYTAKIKARRTYTVRRAINTYGTVKIRYVRRILQYYGRILSRDTI